MGGARASMVAVLSAISASAPPTSLIWTSAATAAPQDPPLAGDYLVSDTHGQPFCRTPDALRRYTIVTVREERYPPDGFPECTIAPYATHVHVVQDLPPYGSLMHMVRARAATALQTVDGYTWSVGLYDARRFRRDTPDGDDFPAIP